MGVSVPSIAILFGVEKLEWCGCPMVKIFYDMFIRFDRIHECDGHTDRQTPHDDIGRICIASCGKNDFDEAVHQT